MVAQVTSVTALRGVYPESWAYYIMIQNEIQGPNAFQGLSSQMTKDGFRHFQANIDGFARASHPGFQTIGPPGKHTLKSPPAMTLGLLRSPHRPLPSSQPCSKRIPQAF